MTSSERVDCHISQESCALFVICPNEVKTESCIYCARKLGQCWCSSMFPGWQLRKISLNGCRFLPNCCSWTSVFLSDISLQWNLISLFTLPIVILYIVTCYFEHLWIIWIFVLLSLFQVSLPRFTVTNHQLLLVMTLCGHMFMFLVTYSQFSLPHFWLYKFYLENTSDKVLWPLS